MTRASTTHTILAAPALAGWKSSLQPISDMLNALGPSLVRTADTGQVNWATMTTPAPTGATMIRDYEIFRFGDDLQATSPVFLRVDYTYVSTTSNITVVRLTVGTSTDGAGNLGGVTTPAVQNFSISATAPTPASGSFNAYASSDGSQLMLVLGLNASGSAVDQWGGFVVERFRNIDGTANGEGYNMWSFDTASTGNAGFLRSQYSRIVGAATQSAIESNPMIMVPNLNTQSTFYSGTSSYAFPFYTFGPLIRGASKALLLGYSADFPRCSEIVLTHYSTVGKFLSLGTSANITLPLMSGLPTTNTNKGGFTPVLRWE